MAQRLQGKLSFSYNFKKQAVEYVVFCPHFIDSVCNLSFEIRFLSRDLVPFVSAA